MKAAAIYIFVWKILFDVTLVRAESNLGGLANIGSNVGRSLQRMVEGLKQAPTQIREVNLLKKRLRLEGENSLSYSDFRLLERSGEDFKKCIRMAFTAYLSRNYSSTVMLQSLQSVPTIHGHGQHYHLYSMTKEKQG